MIEYVQMSDEQSDEPSEEILLRMIRGCDDMTPNNVTTLVDAMGGKQAQHVRAKCKKARNTQESRGKNKINFGSNDPEKMVFNKLGQPVAPSKTVAKFSRLVGSIAREPSVFPIDVPDFRNFKGTGRIKGAWLDIEVGRLNNFLLVLKINTPNAKPLDYVCRQRSIGLTRKLWQS